MAWESRKRGGKYYTRSRRVGGRVKREYIGTGPVAELAAAQDELSRVLKSLLRLKEEISNEALMYPIRQMSDQVDKIHETGIKSIGEYLNEQGYHYHRGEWRKRREI